MLLSCSSDLTAKLWTVCVQQTHVTTASIPLNKEDMKHDPNTNEEHPKHLMYKKITETLTSLQPQAKCTCVYPHGAYTYAAQFHPKATKPALVVTGAFDGAVRVWDRDQGKLLATYRHQHAHINAITFTAAGMCMCCVCVVCVLFMFSYMLCVVYVLCV